MRSKYSFVLKITAFRNIDFSTEALALQLYKNTKYDQRYSLY